MLVGMITVIAAYLVVKGDSPRNDMSAADNQVEKASMEFKCSDNKSIIATFVGSYDSYVELTLDGGAKISLPRAVSTDSIRYTNSDGSIIFWNTLDTASLEENGQMTYRDCILSRGLVF